MEMENHKKGLESPDWSKMPTEIVEEFCKRLRISDQVRFGSVCKTWRSSSSSNKAYLWLPEAPWLVSNIDTSSQFHLVNYTDKKLYKIYKTFKPLRGSFIVGSFKGCLVIRSGPKLIILNLFSKIRIELPSASLGSSFVYSEVDNRFHGLNTPLAYAISTCAKLNPISVAMVTYGGGLAWCKIGGSGWKEYGGDDDVKYGNVVFHNDKLYAVERDGERVDILQVVDGVLLLVASIHSAKPNQSEPIDKEVYLVECGETLLVVKRYYDNSNSLRPTISFGILRVEENCSTPQLVKVDRLEDYVLFVAYSSCESLHVKHCPGLQRGCVYFTGYSRNSITEVGEFSVSDGTMRMMFLTNPHMGYSPFWVMPRFAFECDCECSSVPWIRPRKVKKRKIRTSG